MGWLMNLLDMLNLFDWQLLRLDLLLWMLLICEEFLGEDASGYLLELVTCVF